MIVIKRPIITEKSMKLASQGFYTFEIDKDATKLIVAKKVAEKFSVKVLKVKIINTKSKIKSQKKVRRNYQSAGFKKAIVQISKDQKIAIFETPKEPTSVEATAGKEIESVVVKERKDILGRTKVKVEKNPQIGGGQTTQRKVITGK